MKSLFQMILVVCFISAAVVAGLNAKANGFERSRILVDGEVFNVELAVTPEERSRGLMFRTEMANDAGMLFDFGRAADISMWMKNTFISLDMLFIDAKGTIVGIEKRTVPQSQTIIPTPKPVRFVLELNGGAAERMGFEVGEKVEGLPR